MIRTPSKLGTCWRMELQKLTIMEHVTHVGPIVKTYKKNYRAVFASSSLPEIFSNQTTTWNI